MEKVDNMKEQMDNVCREMETNIQSKGDTKNEKKKMLQWEFSFWFSGLRTQ